MRAIVAGVAVLFALLPTGASAMERTMHAGELAHALDRLAGTGRVLYVAAHPDDENTRPLAWLANRRHVRAAYLSMTRGGGGQNLIGTEQAELLDVIRTEELLAARRIDGAEQRFTACRDFGFSKSAEETFAIWGREEALADLVYVIRSFQPDVIVTRFDERPPNHGHHTASAILAREAFAAAADPARFPELGLPPWKAMRLLHNVPHWRGQSIPEEAISIDVGGFDFRLGASYGEIAARSRSEHKSQGFGVPGERGQLLEHFVVLAGSVPLEDPFEGIDTGWERVPGGGPVGAALEEARAALRRDEPWQALPALLRADKALEQLPDLPRVVDARRELQRIVFAAAGLFLRAQAASPTAAPGGTVEVELEAVAGAPLPTAGLRPASTLSAPGIEIEHLAFPDGSLVVGPIALPPGEKRQIARTVRIPQDAAITTPHFLAAPPTEGRFVGDRALLTRPRGPAAAAIRATVRIGDRRFRHEIPLVHAFTDPVHGERIRPFLVVPPATVTPERQAFLLRNGQPGEVAIRVRAAEPTEGRARLELPTGWRSEPESHAVQLAAGEERIVRFAVRAPAGAAAVEIRPVFEAGDRAWSFREDRIDHPHIPYQQVLRPALLRLVPIELELPKGIVGYVPGPADTVAADLAHAGVRIEILDDATLRAGDLSRYEAIVVGIRAYNARPILAAVHGRLMEYVERGGRLVVQYNVVGPFQRLETPIGPWPIRLDRLRVTDEGAPVLPIREDEPLLAAPNRIGPADFEGWVQERGLYFAAEWDERYRPVFRMADPGEAPMEGSTLVASYGKGRYVYTGLAFFRQLPAGVPGAYRLFVNLLAAP